ncbi:MAG: hypothetical protein IKU58_07950 [Clostridia bacterium]|nr:hypothetical protein [Clostridia bacterium]
MKLFAGFDGGGTKTTCCLADETGRLLGLGRGGPLNYLFCGRETAAASLSDALSSAFADTGAEPCSLAGVFVSSAAILLGHGEAHKPFFAEHLPAERLDCDSDILPVWFGGAGEDPAIVVIAGTGSIAYGCGKDGFTRVGGWGPLLGDEGSGYDLGRRALQTAARMADGRIAENAAFLDAIQQHYGVNTPHELIWAVNGADSREKVAGCARTVFSLADSGDPTARELVAQSARELTLLIDTARKRAGGESWPVVLSGGLSAAMLPRLAHVGDVRLLSAAPAVSAAAIALHRAGLPQAAQRLLKEGAAQ